ncbi:MAG: type II toxin-antitoxin system Phd/YefM family antitoxin [Acidobacteriota bacterium]
MREISVREARQEFSRIIDAVERGEEIVITRRGRPVVRLSAIEKKAGGFPDLTEFRKGISPGKTTAAELISTSDPR